MNLIFLGPPGAGKGTQAQSISSQYNIPQISTGDILREARRNKTELGQKAESYMLAGKLVPDEVVNGIVNERLQQPDCDHGFILDGFPRTVAQAETLSKLLLERKKAIEAAISIEVPDDLIIKRLSGRRICGQCGATYHVDFAPTKTENVCDKCQGQVIQRKDDQADTIKERLRVYKEQTQPLISYYMKKEVLKSVDGTGEVEDVRKRINEVLEQIE